MSMRRDALPAAAQQILAIQKIATETPNLVATVGSMSIHPGAPNSIPGRVTYSIDVRAPNDATRHTAVTTISTQLQNIAAIHNVETETIQTHNAPATQCAPWLQSKLAAAIASQNIKPFHLPSGAGHDAMALAYLCPVGMLFVRCKGGISHTPEESITEADATTAVAVLIELLRHFELEK